MHPVPEPHQQRGRHRRDVELRLQPAPFLAQVAHVAEHGRHQLHGDLGDLGVGRHLAPGSPIRAGDRRVDRAPVLGEHTDTVLAGWLGLTDREIRELHDRGVIQSAQREG